MALKIYWNKQHQFRTSTTDCRAQDSDAKHHKIYSTQHSDVVSPRCRQMRRCAAGPRQDTPLSSVGACQLFPTKRPTSPESPTLFFPLQTRRRSRRKATRDSGAATSGDAGVGESTSHSRVVAMSSWPRFHAFLPPIGSQLSPLSNDDTRPFEPGKITHQLQRIINQIFQSFELKKKNITRSFFQLH